MSGESVRAIPCEFMSDSVLVEHWADGEVRYFRADDPDRREYTYRRPFILELEITRRCNLKCVHCYAEAQDKAFADELTLEEIHTVLDDGRDLGIRELSLTGGEVFLRPDFLSIIDAGLQRSDRYFQQFRRKEDLLTGQCARCPYARKCRAGCTSIAYSATGAVGCNPYCIRALETEQILKGI